MQDETAAAHTYDKSKDKWEKFDVDAALAEADEDTDCDTDDTEQPLRSGQQVCAPSRGPGKNLASPHGQPCVHRQ